MDVATQPSNTYFSFSRPSAGLNSSSMSQGFNQGIYSFTDGFDGRPTSEDQQHVAQQSRRDKMRVQGFDMANTGGGSGHSLVAIDEEGEQTNMYGSDTVGAAANNMLSDMFNFPTQLPPSATELLANQISASYRLPQRPTSMTGGFSGDWYAANRPGIVLGGPDNLHAIAESTTKHQHQHPMTGLSTDSATAMQLFLMNPPQQHHQRSPSPPTPAPPPALHHPQVFHSFGEASFDGTGSLVEGQALSLSLSSSLQQFEMAKANELRVREGVLYLENQQQQQQARQHHHPSLQIQGQDQGGQGHAQLQAMGVVNVLRNSKYSRAAQELLEEFCSVGRGQLKGNKAGKKHASSSNPSPTGGAGASASSTAAAASSSKDVPPLSTADRFEHQRKKAKLISMLDEVDRRYNHYCDQMQMVVNSFDSVMGFGAATPYTALAQKAMSRHFRCLKDAVAAQLKQTCELLGEKDGASSSGITKGETPRLKILDQSLRQQRAFHQMGMMDQEAWRPQRGLPERSVTILRAWLFEHFLHPYPSDADKHLLARQTGLSRNQVSNWFINARVRLWKPMVEEMYQQEFKDESDVEKSSEGAQSPTKQQQQHRQSQRPEINPPHDSATEISPSSSSINLHTHRFQPSISDNPAAGMAMSVQPGGDDNVLIGMEAFAEQQQTLGPAGDSMYRYGSAGASSSAGPVRFGASGDVSLTLGLRHGAGSNAPDKNRFLARDFGGL